MRCRRYHNSIHFNRQSYLLAFACNILHIFQVNAEARLPRRFTITTDCVSMSVSIVSGYTSYASYTAIPCAQHFRQSLEGARNCLVVLTSTIKFNRNIEHRKSHHSNTWSVYRLYHRIWQTHVPRWRTSHEHFISLYSCSHS